MILRYDLHIHSCLSPCGGDDMTPATIAGLCKLEGLDVAALTDHNSCKNCRAFAEAAEAYGLIPLCGMELTTAEEVHVLCLFDSWQTAERFGEAIRPHLPPMENVPEVFGSQLCMDAEDCVLAQETALLAGATDIGVYQVHQLVSDFGGVAIPAHIDRPSYSLISNLGLWDPDMGFAWAELSPSAPPDFHHRPDLEGVRFLTSSDAHYLEQLTEHIPHGLECPEKTPQAVLQLLRSAEQAGGAMS
jgi:hypothetical protein